MFIGSMVYLWDKCILIWKDFDFERNYDIIGALALLLFFFFTSAVIVFLHKKFNAFNLGETVSSSLQYTVGWGYKARAED